MKKLLSILLFVPFLSFSQSLLLQENSSLSLATNSSTVSLSNGFTLEVWYTPQPSQGEEQIVGSMNHGFYGPNGCDYSTSGIGFWHGGGILYAEVNDGVNEYSISSSNYIPNQWTHLAMTYDGEKFKFFINGILEESQSIDLFPFIMVDLLINFHSWCGGASSRIDGARIDELRLSSIPRYTNEFSPQLYNFNNDEFTLGLWHFDSDSGDSPFPSCQDTLALNYSITNNNSDTLCIYGIPGCTDPNAFNFEVDANVDDGSCISQEEYVIDSLQTELITLNEEATTSLSSLQQALDTWNTIIDLSAGWNMFGYGCPSSIDVAEGLSNHTESIIITKDNNGAVYMPEFGFNGIGDFTPGFGYQIKLTEAIEGFSLCDWYVNDIPEDNIVSLQEENADLNQQIKCLTNPEIGDFCHGGIIFYIDSNNEYGLVMAEEDVNGLYEWGCHNLTDNISFTNSIGLGYENSINISENNCLDLGELSAAEAALNFQSNSYNDWYLPSNKELITIYDSLDVISLGFENSYYWSSSPHSTSEMAYCIQPILGYTANIQSTTNTFKVRPIRAFGNWTMGCMDETACNFNPEANMADGSCTYPEQLFDCDGNKYGCLDEVACNYDETAFLDNGSCDYAQQGYDCDGNILEIGVEAYGGIVYYIDESGEHGLVAAPQDIGQHSWFDAIDVCNDYVINGYTDWYLPNVIELDLMYNSIGPHLEIDYGFSNEVDANLSWYWASDDYGFAGGTITFSNGQQHFGHVKSELSHVRPIRSF